MSRPESFRQVLSTGPMDAPPLSPGFMSWEKQITYFREKACVCFVVCCLGPQQAVQGLIPASVIALGGAQGDLLGYWGSNQDQQDAKQAPYLLYILLDP